MRDEPSQASRNTPTRFPELVVSGAPRELGRQIGEATREAIQGFCESAVRMVNKTVRIGRERAMEIARACIPKVQAYRPDLIEELQGTAEAAGVQLADLMLLQIRNQLQPERDAGCTALSIAASASADGRAIVAQNWDNDPELDPYTVVLTRRPTGRPASIAVTQAGLIAYIGFSETGIGACVNTLPAPSRPVGVPHYFTLREIYEARGTLEAVRAVKRAERAIPANIVLATPDGPADLEVTVDDVHPLNDQGRGWIAHTNHCVHPELAPINDDFPELIQSHPRLSRACSQLERAAGPFSIQDVQRLLRDHQGHPRSICRHANDDPDCGFWETVFSIISQPEAGRMLVTRGTPCCRPYEEYLLTR